MQMSFPVRHLSIALVMLWGTSCGWLSNLAVADDGAKVVDLFEAIDAGQVVARFIPADAAKANVLLTNKTDAMLQVQLPEAIAAVPVLAQFGQDLGQNGGGGQGGTQGVGGGFNAQGGGNGPGFGGGNNFGGNQRNQFGPQQGNGLGMGFMRIAPQKTRKLTARTVCLEHGKPDPHPRVAYRMIPIDSFTTDAAVIELCRRVARGDVRRTMAQAAAWHLQDGLSWEALADMNRLESRYLGNIKFFKPSDLKRARELVGSLRAQTSTEEESPGHRYASTD